MSRVYVLCCCLFSLAACHPSSNDAESPPPAPATATCADGGQDAACADAGLSDCDEGQVDTRPCGSGGSIQRTCEHGEWSDWSLCPGTCPSGASQDVSCGLNGRGTQRSTCVDGSWQSDACVDPDECSDGSYQQQKCGKNARGTMQVSCESGKWSGSTCDDPDFCTDGDTTDTPCDDGSGSDGGTETASCTQGQWVTNQTCRCQDGAQLTQTCGLNSRGARPLTCASGTWQPGACTDPDVCTDGDTRADFPCGLDNSGATGASCQSGQWLGDTSWCSQRCGDGTIEGAETCDDFNTVDGDGCTALCTLEPLRLREWYMEQNCTSKSTLGMRSDGTAYRARSCFTSSVTVAPASAGIADRAWLEYASPPVGLGLGTKSHAFTLWSSDTARWSWTPPQPPNTQGGLVDFDDQLNVTAFHALTSPKINAYLADVASVGDDRLLVGQFMTGSQVSYEGITLSTPDSAAAQNVFVYRQRPAGTTGFALGSKRAVTSSRISGNATHTAVVIESAADNQLTLLGKGLTPAPRSLLLSDDAQVMAVPLTVAPSSEQGLRVLDNGYVIVTGEGEGTFNTLSGSRSFTHGILTLIYDSSLALVGASSGWFLGQTASGELAIMGAFTGSEVTLDEGMLSEQRLAAPFGPHNRYVGFYKLSGALSSARIVESATDATGGLPVVDLDAPGQGFAIARGCTVDTWFGDATTHQTAKGGANTTCLARYDQAGVLLWAAALLADPASLVVALDGTDTWYAGSFSNPFAAQQQLRQVDLKGRIKLNEHLLNTNEASVSQLRASHGRAVVELHLAFSSFTLFPDRPWHQVPSWSQSPSDMLISVDPALMPAGSNP